MVAAHTQPASHGGKRHTAFAQFTKHSVTHCGEVVPAFCTRLCGDLWLTIFEMDVPDALIETVQTILNTRAISATRTIEVVASIKDQPQQVRGRHIKKACDLVRCFNIPRTMVMERGTQPGCVTHSTRNTLCTDSEGFPLCLAQAHVRRDTTSMPCTHRVGAILVGKHNERDTSSAICRPGK